MSKVSMSQKSKEEAMPRSSASRLTARPSCPLHPVTSVLFGAMGTTSLRYG